MELKSGQMAQSMLVNGKMARLKAKELFTILMVTFSKESLRWTKQMDMEHISIKVAKLIREAGLTICKRDKALKSLRMEVYMRVHFTMA